MRMALVAAITFILTSALTPVGAHRVARVPILVPTDLQWSSNGRVYENVSARRGYYEIYFSAVPNDGSDAAYIANVEGGIAPTAPSDRPGAVIVRLRDGTPATFWPFACGASCGQSTLEFRRHGIWYGVYLHSGTLKETLRAANSSLPAR